MWFSNKNSKSLSEYTHRLPYVLGNHLRQTLYLSHDGSARKHPFPIVTQLLSVKKNQKAVYKIVGSKTDSTC